MQVSTFHSKFNLFQILQVQNLNEVLTFEDFHISKVNSIAKSTSKEEAKTTNFYRPLIDELFVKRKQVLEEASEDNYSSQFAYFLLLSK